MLTPLPLYLFNEKYNNKMVGKHALSYYLLL